MKAPDLRRYPLSVGMLAGSLAATLYIVLVAEAVDALQRIL